MKRVFLFCFSVLMLTAYGSAAADNGEMRISSGLASPEPGMWRAITAEQIGDNPVTLFSRDWALLSAGERGDLNTMTIGWGSLGYIWGGTGGGERTGMVTVYVHPDRYTDTFMERFDHFTVTIFPEQYREALGVLGSRSGRDGDKIAASGLTLQFTPGGNPTFGEGRLVIECRKVYTDRFRPEGYSEHHKNRIPHKIYIGEIVNVWEMPQ